MILFFVGVLMVQASFVKKNETLIIEQSNTISPVNLSETTDTLDFVKAWLKDNAIQMDAQLQCGSTSYEKGEVLWF